MRKITVLSFLSIDGVMQAPGRPEEDTSGDFRFGGWMAPYVDEVFGDIMKKLMEPSDLLLGRKTFEIWENYWPGRESGWVGINEVTKFVVSRTSRTSNWKNSVFLKDAADVKALKSSEGGDIQVWGSGNLVQTLLQNDLVDELRLKIFPLTLGSGKKLFEGGSIAAAFTLAESQVTPSGIIVAHYIRAGEVKTGSMGS